MDVLIQSLGFKAGQGLESYVSEKVNKLDHMTDNVVRADVTLFMGPESQPDKYHCEIRLEVPGKDHFVKKNADTFEKAVMSAVGSLQNMVRKVKARQSDKRPNV